MLEESKVGTKLVGFYRGEVRKHCERGKCKIFWPGVTPNEFGGMESIDKLPEAEQAAPLFASAYNVDGVFFYPDLGTTVWGFFENGDINHPVYFASTLNSEDRDAVYNTDCKEKIKTTEDYNGNESRRTAVISLGDLKVKINAEKKALEISDNSTDSKISFTDEGISITSPKQIKIEGDSVEIRSNILTDIKANGEVAIVGGAADSPGGVSVFGNGIDILASGTGVFISGNMESKRYL